MSLLTLSETRTLFETDLVDAALQLLLDAAEQEIVQHAGEHATESDAITAPLSDTLFLSRKASSITEVRERVGDVETTLAADDYRLLGQTELKRTNDGTNPRPSWGDEIVVDYVPVSDLTTRKRAQLDLVKLSAQYNAASGESSGDYSKQAPEYQLERNKILSQLVGWFAR